MTEPKDLPQGDPSIRNSARHNGLLGGGKLTQHISLGQAKSSNVALELKACSEQHPASTVSAALRSTWKCHSYHMSILCVFLKLSPIIGDDLCVSSFNIEVSNSGDNFLGVL